MKQNVIRARRKIKHANPRRKPIILNKYLELLENYKKNNSKDKNSRLEKNHNRTG